MNLFNKLWSQVLHWNVDEILKCVFIGKGSYHRDTIAIREETLQKTSDSIFLVDRLRKTFLCWQGFLKIFLCIYWITFRVNQLQSEITDNPHERWEVFCEFLWIYIFIINAWTLYLNMLCEVYDKVEVLKCIFIDWADWIVNEVWGKQDCQWEYSNIMVRIFIESTKSFSIHDDNLDWISIGSLTF